MRGVCAGRDLNFVWPEATTVFNLQSRPAKTYTAGAFALSEQSLLWDISISKGVIFLHVQTLIRLRECILIWFSENICGSALTKLTFFQWSVLHWALFLAIYMLSYMEILICFVWCLLILFYYVIKMKIKQLKIFFFCLYFNLVLSRNSFTTCTSVLQMYIIGNLVQWNSTCILYFGDDTFWLCRTSDISKYFLHSLGLWDNEVDLYMSNLR